MIARVKLRGEALAREIARCAPRERDRLVDDLLALDAPDPSRTIEKTPHDPELVDYLPSGVSAIADAIVKARIGTDDLFCDVGSGTGRVAILVHLLTGARTIGIEHRADLVEVARQGAARLALDGVDFVIDDARRAALCGDVFYLYLPFVGGALRQVIQRLERVATHKPIRIATLGMALREEPWLHSVDTTSLWLDVYETPGALRTRRSPLEMLPSLAVIADERHHDH